MKSSWICWLIAASLLAGAPAGAAERGKRRSADELINVFLSPGKAQWLVGPIARLATDEEIDAFLEIADEQEAERFIDEFWSRRRPIGGVPGRTARQQFEALAEEADRLYGEATFPGRRTDRGTIFILYGPPEKIEYKPARRKKLGEVEVWLYDTEKVGLHGKKPKRAYNFIQEDDLTRFAISSELPKLLP
ncbi:MAG: GWxTD domain-containing protein [Thermoanaerobaculia bacterium]